MTGTIYIFIYVYFYVQKSRHILFKSLLLEKAGLASPAKNATAASAMASLQSRAKCFTVKIVFEEFHTFSSPFESVMPKRKVQRHKI